MENILVILGTKGQYVKMAPVLLEMDRRGISYLILHANQHPRITQEISDTFGLRKPDLELIGLQKDIASNAEALNWLVRNISLILRGSILDGQKIRHIRELISKNALVVIHGDAPPAFLSLLLAKRFGLRIAHVEAGERTHDLIQPFPEEIIRILVDRYADLLFAGSAKALKNLEQERIRGQVVDIGINTLLDSVRFVLENRDYRPPYKAGDYVLISLHRFELINSRNRLMFMVHFLERELAGERLVMTLHESTRRGLQRAGLLSRLYDLSNLDILPLRPYHEFIHLMANAKFVVTDGGGPQQESHILGVPCIVLRETVEQPGYENICVCGFDLHRIRESLDAIENLRIGEGITRFDHLRPSKIVVDHIEKYV